MSGQTTERYRLALIAHHAERLAKLISEQNGRGKTDWWFGLTNISPYYIMTLARIINNHLNKEEK